MITNEKKGKSISAKISKVEIEIIKIYILGAINGSCNTNKDGEFSIRILFGGDNRDWSDTPLQWLYNYYIKNGKIPHEAAKKASVDAGCLLAEILKSDSRTFEIAGSDTGNLYKMVK